MTPVREIIFVSHANPEDNEFTRWISLRLASLGYGVWSDVTRLLGGEDFWDDIERAIRENTVKFLYVLSQSSNHKIGSLKELKVAQSVQSTLKLQDFVIPLKIDDLSFADTNIELSRLNAIDFSTGWAGGLKQLVGKLEKDRVPKHPNFGPNAVRTWWENSLASENGLVSEPDIHLSNWFRVQLPEHIYVHKLMGLYGGDPEFTFPTKPKQNGLVTFAPASDLKEGLGTLQVQATVKIPTNEFLHQGDRDEVKENRNTVTSFLRQAWELYASSRKLNAYQMSSNRNAYYFDLTNLPEPEVKFKGVGGRQSRRGLMGYATMTKGKRHWHFAISSQPAVHPEPMLMLKSHVLFSDDGIALWDSPKRMHKARRSQCKQWWNDDWRDRLMASVSWLANGAESVRLPVGQTVFAELALYPIEFESPIRLKEDARTKEEEPEEPPDDPEDDLDDDDAESEGLD